MAASKDKLLYININWLFVRSIVCILGAVLFWIYPDMLVKSLIIGIGVLLVLSGITSFFITYSQNKGSVFYYFGVAGAILLTVLGILFIANTGFFVKCFVFVIGIMIIILALFQLAEIINMFRYDVKKNVLSYLSPVLLFVFGVIVVIKPAGISSFIGILAAIALLYYGIIGVVLAFRTRKLIKEKNRQANAV